MTDDDKFRAIHDRFIGVDSRLDRHERRIQSVETARAVADESQKHLDAKFAELRKHLDTEIQSIKKPLYTVVAGVILALLGGLMSFIMQGGLNAAG